MELKIINPPDGWLAKEIQWNNEELKAELQAKMADHENLVFTEETISDAKKDRAALNKLKNAFEGERKRVKKMYLEPYNRFEAQVKELTALIEKPIGFLDVQIREVEENRKARKREEIEALFVTIGFQCFVRLEQIWDEKWLNASVSMAKIEEQMKSEMYRIGEENATISRLSEYSFEAMDTYKRTLDLSMAIQEGQRLSEIQKQKEGYERTEKERAEKERAGVVGRAVIGAVAGTGMGKAADAPKAEREEQGQAESEKITLDFRVVATKGQLSMLKAFLIENRIQYGPVPNK